jgi:hypothetical protein
MTTQTQLDALRALVNPLAAGAVTQAQVDAIDAAVAELVADPIAQKPAPLQRVQIGETAADGPTWALANNILAVSWRTPGGDYLDAKGTSQGSVPFARIPAAAFKGAPHWLTVDVSTLVESLRADNTGIFLHLPIPEHPTKQPYPAKFASRETATPPKLSVVTDAGTFDCACICDTWLASSSAYPQGNGLYLSTPAILRFDLAKITSPVRSATLSLYHSAYGGEDICIDFLDTPELLTVPAAQHPELVQQGIAATVANDSDLAKHPDVLLYVVPSATTMPAAATGTQFQAEYGASGAEYLDWPQFGMRAVRVMNTTAYQTALHFRAQFLNMPGVKNPFPWAKGPGTAPEHLFIRYLLMLEADVGVGSCQGTKIPGASGSQSDYVCSPASWGASAIARNQEWGFSLEHSLPSPSNGNAVAFGGYIYDMDKRMTNPDRGAWTPTGAALRPGRLDPYCIEMQMDMNTIGAVTNAPLLGSHAFNHDGVLNLWLDGVPVYRNSQRAWRDTPFAQILGGEVLIMHGGNLKPIATQHYQFGGYTVATQYIGPPKRVAA